MVADILEDQNAAHASVRRAYCMPKEEAVRLNTREIAEIIDDLLGKTHEIVDKELIMDGSRPEFRHNAQLAQTYALMAIAVGIMGLLSKDCHEN